MLQLKDLWGRGVGEKVTAWDGKILKELEGLAGGREWFAGIVLSDRAGICDSQGCGGRRKEVKRGVLWANESSGQQSHGIVPQKYSTCQDRFEINLEVIGGAGVRGRDGKLETRKQKLEIRKQKPESRKKRARDRGRVKSTKTKGLALAR